MNKFCVHGDDTGKRCLLENCYCKASEGWDCCDYKKYDWKDDILKRLSTLEQIVSTLQEDKDA